eukprot:426294_1
MAEAKQNLQEEVEEEADKSPRTARDWAIYASINQYLWVAGSLTVAISPKDKEDWTSHNITFTNDYVFRTPDYNKSVWTFDAKGVVSINGDAPVANSYIEHNNGGGIFRWAPSAKPPWMDAKKTNLKK